MNYELKHIRQSGDSVDGLEEVLQCMNDLHPELKVILDKELLAGNLVLEASRGWPEEHSIFIHMRERFTKKHDLHDKVKFTESDDPHWWEADYSCGKPVHILACTRK